MDRVLSNNGGGIGSNDSVEMDSVNRARQDSLPQKMHLNKQMMARGVLGESQFTKDQYARGHYNLLIKTPQVKQNTAARRRRRKRAQDRYSQQE